MSKEQGPPPVDDKWRMLLRIGAVVLGYILYLVIRGRDAGLAPAILMWAGTVVFGWALVDRYTLWRRERLGLMQVGSTILGVGLIVLALVLALS